MRARPLPALFFCNNLNMYLSAAGFSSCQRVASFGLFEDTSEYAPYGRAISLNVLATK